ncbi:MAG: hypothetical protein ACRDRY_25300, partial [Pseudonocardiaceae bacterium]
MTGTELTNPVTGSASGSRRRQHDRRDRAGQYRRSVAAAENLTSGVDSSDALQACGMLHLSAALAARMDTEVGTWFGPVNVGIWRTSLAVELGEYGQ